MGIYGALPVETLHAWILGLMEYMIEGVYSHEVSPRNPVTMWLDHGGTREIQEVA
jgi:hypothetical protein